MRKAFLISTFRASSRVKKPARRFLSGSVSGNKLSQENSEVSGEVKAQFHLNGYVVLKQVLASSEMSQLKRALEQSDAITGNSYYVGDGMKGRGSRLSIWCHPGHDITGIVARSEKVAGTMEQASECTDLANPVKRAKGQGY
eukprot:m.79407 g.79407  ORF g.79407 m.79407 type:complete len:142 (+) comp36136_c0_seq10:7-432(+)